MGQVCGKVLKETPMWVNGSLVKLMGMVCIHGSMVIAMKESLKIALNMVKDYKNSQMETFTKDFMFKENHPDLVNITGQMEATLKVHLRWVYVAVMEYGKKDQEIVTNMKDSTLMIKNQVMVFLHGQAEMYTRGIMRMTQEMVMEKCIGWMAVFIRGIGGMAFNMEKGRFTYLVRG